MHQSEDLPGPFVEGEESHGARIVDLRQSGDEAVAEFLHRGEQGQLQVGFGDMAEELPIERSSIFADL